MEEYANHSDVIQEAYAKFPPLQIQWELIELLHVLEELQPKVICEIGLGNAGTFYVLSKYFPNAKLISIDILKWVDPQGNHVDNSHLGPLIKTFAEDVTLIAGDTRDQSTVDKLKEVLGGKTIDFLFIDGDHSYDMVKSDFEKYSPFVRNGVVAFHDICPSTQSSPVPVHETIKVHVYWNIIKRNHEYREIIRSPGQSSQGIGVLWKD
jgi:cephalosporin hydroxylase